MKRYLILFGALSLLTAGCARMADEVFDRSAAERIAESMKEYQKVLVDNRNGWVVQYWPKTTRDYGGFNLYFKFEANGMALVGSDIPETGGELESSRYTMDGDVGPTVNFNEGNSTLNYFADPALPVGAGTGRGYEGDYEFVIVSAAPELVILRGKKTHNVIRLLPMPDDTTWPQYLASVNRTAALSAAPEYTCDFGGVDGLTCLRTGRRLSFTLTTVEQAASEDEEDVVTEEKFTAPFVYTTSGIRLYEPLAIAGHTVQEFVFDEVSETFSAVNGDEKLTMFFPPINEIFAATPELWYFAGMSPSLQAIYDAAAAGSDYPVTDGPYIGASPAPDTYPGKMLVLLFFAQGRNYYYFDEFSFTPGADDVTIELAFVRSALNGGAMPAFAAFRNALAGTWTMEADDPRNPAQYRFTSASDPEKWFVMEL